MIEVAQQINATMSTKIALDLLSASESVKSLTAVVRSSQNAWKAQEAEMKSAGDAVGAAQAKYDGLGKSIESQQSKIDALKAKQAELKGNTADVAQQFLKYQQQIDGATKQLASMQAQQDRAKQAMDYQKSGLAGLQQEYTAAARANQAYVTRLEAEGNQQEANKAKMEGYKSSISNLNEQLSKQSAELDKIASASGKDSDAWRTQKTRVDETATSLAKAKSSMTGLQTEMDKANPSVFNRVKEAISGTNKQAEKTPGLLHKIVEGGLITNAITSGWQRLSSSITDTVKSGLELNEAGEKLNMTWENMGKSANDIQILSDQMSYLRSETGATGGEINNMQTTVDTMTHGVTDKTLVISAGIASIATASHKGGDGMDSLSKAMTRVVASGNLTTTNLAKLEKQAPTLGAQLAKAAGVSQDSFAKMVADGKIKSDDFMNLVYKVGTTSKSTFDQFGKTSEGALAQLSGSWTSIKAKMAAPLLNVKNSGMQSLAGILTSSVVQKAATTLGKGLATIANWAKNVLDYVSAHKKDVTGIAEDMWDIAKIAGKEVWSLFKTAIKDIAGWLNVGGSNAKTMKDPLKAIHDVLDDIVKNKSGIQTTVKVIAGLWMTKKALEFAAGLGHVYSGLKALGDTKLAQSILSNFSKLNIGSKLAKIAVPVVIAYDAISDLKDLTKAFSKHGTVGQKFSAVGETSGSLIGGGIGFMLGGPAGAAIGATIGKVAGKWAGNAAKKFTDGWNAKKKPANSWLGGLGWDARQMTNNVVKWWDGINKSTDKAQKKQQKQQEAANKRAQKEWNGFWGDVGKGWTRFWNDVNKKNSSAQQQQKKQQEAANKQIKKDWDSFWSNASNGWNNFWSDTLKNAKNGMHDTKSRIDSANDNIHKAWDNFWSDTSKNWNGFWGTVGKNAQSGMSTVHGWINNGNSKINSGWRSMWSGLKSFFDGIWDGIKHAASDGMNAVINVINGAIGGINWVWEKFTGKSALRKLSHVHFANGGIVTQKMHLVMVNDGTGPDWKELYQLPNGQIGMSQQRNATGLLPEGTRVFNGKETKAIMNMAGVEHYDLGGVIGGVGKFFSGAWDKLEAVGDWLANPVGKVTDLIKSSISGISGGVEMFSNLAGGVINKLTGSVVDWFKKELAKLQDTLGANPGGSGVQRWKPYVIQALKANGFDASAYQIAAWMRVIQRESNGNPKAINLWDSNAKAGIPSMGLVQTIGPTFNAFKFPGHNDVYNGYDDLLAGIHYMKAIYGSGSSAFARVSGPEGYANGGLITRPIHALVGEDGPETILPLTKTSRAWQLLGQAVTNINHNLGNGAVAETKDGDTDGLGKKLDNIADLLTKLSFVLQIGDDQFYPKVAPKVKQYNDRTDRFNAYWKGGTV
ncbi:tape measure protein [Lacticaseibacillus paracasei]|uniref:tape measure protein n=1 Tax=Lacticaseibacillus paracasei TaxID=1597 RepID=UPI0016427E25|nr:tape measure protein [Lacticaseibacillus paracasei]MCZ2766166.1 tape measure protein [Lacticaseibacillus paracasei]MCZ2769123.1 tape measure protein [Lacticaseibacillus paracasei]MCZ2774632.1 tape measure protein [Lacticaseibacillus paracasei]MCZ2777589.1 tape measure protein [Lacticaseibacillus paracasei]MCZ2783637.1 tape measure protein [Lacticaseibacillus paracasei]